jgi:hypothetical protein
MLIDFLGLTTCRYGRKHTFYIEVLNIDIIDRNFVLFEIGIYQNKFTFDLLFYKGIKRLIQDWMEK